MSKLILLAIVAALCIHLSHAFRNPYIIIGRAYCDPCHSGQETNLAEYIQGAVVQLQCRHAGNHTVAHTAQAITDKMGWYTMHLDNDNHQEDCEVMLLKSTLPYCYQAKNGSDRVTFAIKSSDGPMNRPIRVGSLAFMKDKPLDICDKMLKAHALADKN